MIEPHGGRLVDQTVPEQQQKDFLKRLKEKRYIIIDNKTKSDLIMIGTGLMSPLCGFMTRKDYERVIHEMRLSNGVIFPIPITLAVESYDGLKEGDEVALRDQNNNIVGSIDIEDIYEYDPIVEAKEVFGTDDENHPGVQITLSRPKYYVGGKIWLIHKPEEYGFVQYYRTPQQTRTLFQKMGWQTICAFQTRNPIHRAHEYLQKVALEITDGLFINPLVGDTKKGDIPADIRMKCYLVLLENYYPKERVVLSIFPAYMRYAGPKEAIFHAICRKNYGCTHFIVGRDHAGVGNYYGTYDAQKIFDNFDENEIGIEILKFEHAFFCKRCNSMATAKTCPHPDQDHIFLSGTKVRKMLSEGKRPPLEFTRKEVADILIEYYNNSGI